MCYSVLYSGEGMSVGVGVDSSVDWHGLSISARTLALGRLSRIASA